MADAETCPNHARLLDNYQQCLAWRMEMWFGDEFSVKAGAGHTLEVHGRGSVAGMEFFPDTCSWRLSCGEHQVSGSFDRVSKRLRQLLSQRV